MTPDPLCEKYYSISPYVYCLNNPLKYIDKNGRDPGDVFKTVHGAAKDWGMYYNGASILRGIEFGSTIYEIKKDGEVVGYAYSVATEGKGDGHVNPSLPPKFEKEVADIHSHEDYPGYDSNKFSTTDKTDNNRRKNIGFVATPNGSLLEYDPSKKNNSTKGVSVVSTDLPSDSRDPSRKNKVEPTDVPKEKKWSQTRAEQEKKPEVKVPDNQKDSFKFVF